MIYLNDACRAALSDHLKIRTSDVYRTVTDKALFLSRLNVRINVKTVQAMVYRYLKRAGLESKHYSVHKLRHTAATLMYQSGKVDVRVLKDILGHEQLMSAAAKWKMPWRRTRWQNWKTRNRTKNSVFFGNTRKFHIFLL